MKYLQSNMQYSEEKIFYVYVHKRKTDGSIFYVGKGKGNRSTSKSGRSKHWKNIVNKNGYYVEIVKDKMKECDAFLFEINMISELREKGVSLCNISSGGEGASGVIHTEETKQKFRLAKLGKKQNPDLAQHSRTVRIGMKNKPEHIEATVAPKRKKVINSEGEIFASASEAARVISKRLGVKCSQGNISMCARGERDNAYNLTWSYDTSKIPNFIPTKRNSRRVLCVDDNVEFDSTREAAEWIGGVCQSISYAALHNKKAYGKSWKYIDD